MSDVRRSQNTASVFGIAAVFGGGAGMSAASAFGLDAGGGFIVGSTLVFLILAVAVFQARELERVSDLGKLIEGIADRQRWIDTEHRS